jgi:hypothetical protein
VRLTAVHPFCEKFAAAGPVQYLVHVRRMHVGASQLLPEQRNQRLAVSVCSHMHAGQQKRFQVLTVSVGARALERACCRRDTVRAVHCTAMQALHTMPASLHVHAMQKSC